MGNASSLPRVLAFDPDWVKDPVPWILQYLDHRAALRVALVRVEFHQRVQKAQAQALDQLQEVLQGELGGK